MSNEVVIRAGCIRIIGRAKNEAVLAKLVCHYHGFTLAGGWGCGRKCSEKYRIHG